MPTAEQLKRQLLELSILTLITIVVWIGYGIYSALTQPSEAMVSQRELSDVPTDLDLLQLNSLQERLVITDEMMSVLESESEMFKLSETVTAATSSPASPPGETF
jgi:hypothetical protein